MNYFLQSPACFCCSDIKKYQAALDNARQITQLLTMNVPLSSQLCRENDFRPLQTDSTHIHFMCGLCHKDTGLLRIAESELRSVLQHAVAPAREDEQCRQYVLRLLQGHYPATYRQFERVTLSRDRKETLL